MLRAPSSEEQLCEAFRRLGNKSQGCRLVVTLHWRVAGFSAAGPSRVGEFRRVPA